MKKQGMSMVKGVALALAAGAAAGYAGKAMMDRSPKMKKKAGKALNTMGTLIETAQYMFK